SFSVTVSIADVGGATASASLTATVADAALTATAGSNISATEGSGTGSVIVATFTDANPGDHTTDFTATIDWGDTHSSAGTISYDSGTGVYTVTASHTYAEEGSFSVTVSIADVG